MSYELRQLYTGRDGRRVSVAFPTSKAFRYDTQTFDGSSAGVSLSALDVDLDGLTQSETRLVPRRATAGTARLRSTSTHDDFGNVVSTTAFGCVEGCPAVDEAITVHGTITRVPDDASGWLWRPTESFVTGSIQTAARQRVRHEYNARGDLERSFVTLSGTLPLDRFHESTATIAPAPPNASGGTAAPIEIEVAAYAHDPFGNGIQTRAPLGRCSSVQLDGDYAELPVAETIHGGNVGSGGCGERAFVTQATYDRGLAQVLTTTSITGQPAQFAYDGFGRLASETYAWRYAYNDAGDLVGTSDARGCGVNYHYDAAGNL